MSRIRTFAKLLAPVALLSLGACATPFRADVSRFQSQLPAPQGQTFVVKAIDQADEGGIEFGQYASLVSAEMQKLGYVPASSSNADLTVKLDYGVDDGKERTVVYDWQRDLGLSTVDEAESFGPRQPNGTLKPDDPVYELLAKMQG